MNTAVYHIPEKKGPYRYFKLSNVTTYLHVNKILIADFDVYDTIFSPLLAKRVTIEKDIYLNIRPFYMFIITSLL